MQDVSDKKQACVKGFKKIGLIIAGLFVFYVIVGFWVVPPLLKPRLEEHLSSSLGRQVTIAEIKFNPLVLSARISNLVIHEKDGQPFAGFENLYANAQLSSLIKWAFTVREIRVQAPFGVVKLLPELKFNIDDIIAKFTEPKPESEEEDAGLPPAIIERFQVIDGKVAVEDLSGKEPIRDELGLISFTLENLSTLKGRKGEYRFKGTSSSGERYEANGLITINPVRVQGSVSVTGIQLSHYWKYIKDIVSFQIVSGTTEVAGEYTVGVVDDRLNARLENGAFKLKDFELVEKGKKKVLIALPVFSVKGMGADLQDREITVEQIHAADGRIQSSLLPEGSFELQGIFLPDLENLMQKIKSKEPDESPPAQPWRVVLKKMEVKNGELFFEDRSLIKPAKLSADKLNVVVENLTNEKNKTATIGVAMRINQAGNVKIKGKGGIVPLQADLDVVTDKITLKTFQPYVDDAVNARIFSGTISSKSRIRYRGKDVQPQIRYDGEFSIFDVVIQDRLQTKDFITLAQLKTSGVGLELGPNKLNVDQILIERPHARITVDKASVVNVVDAFAFVKKEKKEEEQNLLQRLVNFLILNFRGPIPMRIDRVQLKTFTVDFMDGSVSPTFGTHVEISDATATGLSSDPSAKADFKLTGNIDDTATLNASGQMSPMNALQDSNMDVSLKDFMLKPVSPYSGKFIGYKIDRGTLHTDLKYQIANDTVDGDNIIVIDQLEIGERVHSPHALNLPIKLGVTLLKDREGRIKVQVPVKGNVMDPQFNFRKTIWSALTGIIKDVGNTPFSAISEVDGFRGEELRRVEFEFGFFQLQDREVQKLNALAKLLKQRDALVLGIVGTADRQMDGAAIMGESPGKILTTDAPASEQTTPAKWVAKPVVDIKRLEQLAQRRADKVSAYLVEQGGVDANRIQVKPLQIKSAPDGERGGVEFSLSVK